jgi:membrane associated rhomboid family serine protease
VDRLNYPGALVILIATIVTSFIGLNSSPKLIDRCLFRPYWFLRRRQYATLVTSGFVHADLGHLLLNMFTFYFFAFDLEAYLGTVMFLALYLSALVLSHACTYFKNKDNPGYASLGASGAISGVLFAYIVYSPTAKIMILPIPIPIPAVLFAVAYVAYSYWAGERGQGRINHYAHLCGALAGIIFVAVTDPGAIGRLVRFLS